MEFSAQQILLRLPFLALLLLGSSRAGVHHDDDSIVPTREDASLLRVSYIGPQKMVVFLVFAFSIGRILL